MPDRRRAEQGAGGLCRRGEINPADAEEKAGATGKVRVSRGQPEGDSAAGRVPDRQQGRLRSDPQVPA